MMKKIYFAILILVLALSVSAFTDIPSPPGRGTYFESGDNATFSYITANNLPDRLPVENIQNLYPHSFEFGQWTSSNLTFQDLGTFQLVTYGVGAEAFSAQAVGEAGKRYTITMKCKLVSPASEGDRIRLYQWDQATQTQAKYFELPFNKETTIRWTTPDAILAPSFIGWSHDNETGAVQISEISVREFDYAKMVVYGSSFERMAKLGVAGVCGTAGVGCYESFGFANLYSNEYNLELQLEAVDGYGLADMLTKMEATIDLTKKIPIMIIGGGGNDIIQNPPLTVDPTPDMLPIYAAQVALARKVCPNIILNMAEPYNRSASYPTRADGDGGMSAVEDGWRLGLNAELLAIYGNETDITLMDLDDALYSGGIPDATKYATDLTHPNEAGQLAWKELLDSTFTFPKELVDTVAYTETSRDAINTQSELTKLNTPKYITITGTPLPLSASNWVVSCDTDTFGGVISVNLPEGFNKDNVTVINMGSTHNVNVKAFETDPIYGVAGTVPSPTIFSFGMGKVYLQFNPVSGWW